MKHNRDYVALGWLAVMLAQLAGREFSRVPAACPPCTCGCPYPPEVQYHGDYSWDACPWCGYV